MRLKVPEATTHVQTPNKVYEIKDGFIEVSDNSPDLPFFKKNGFVPSKKNDEGAGENPANPLTPKTGKDKK